MRNMLLSLYLLVISVAFCHASDSQDIPKVTEDRVVQVDARLNSLEKVTVELTNRIASLELKVDHLERAKKDID